MDPQQLSRELRESDTPDMVRRRWIISLSMIGASVGQIVSLYQTGVIDRLPDLPIPHVDSDRVDASNYAYSRLDTPDGLMMITNYALTAWLAGAGGLDRAQKNPILPIAMGLKTLIDAAIATKLAQEEWTENQAFCEYCQLATLCSYLSVALAAPEAMTALRNLLDQRDKNPSLQSL